MKTIPVMAVVALALAAVSCSSVKTAQTQTKPTAYDEGSRSQRVPLTGSYIKQDIRKTGIVTDGANPVYVLDDQEIRNTGAGDLSELLIRRGFRR
jgi:hypothetical protein